MKKTLRVSVLVILLAFSVYAGDMPNGVTGDMPNGAPAPPPAHIVQVTVDETQNSPETDSTASEVFLTLLQSILALF